MRWTTPRLGRGLRLPAALAAAAALAASCRGGAVRRRWAAWTVPSSAYDRLIGQAASRHGLSPSLVKAVVWKESRFRADCVGRAQEMGLMQITDGAVKDWQAAFGGTMPNRAMCFDPGLNIEIGTWYLARAMRTWKQYRSADILALAEYNAGGSRAREWAPPNPQVELTLAGIRLPGTRDYIAKVKQKWHEFERAQTSSQ